MHQRYISYIAGRRDSDICPSLSLDKRSAAASIRQSESHGSYCSDVPQDRTPAERQFLFLPLPCSIILHPNTQTKWKIPERKYFSDTVQCSFCFRSPVLLIAAGKRAVLILSGVPLPHNSLPHSNSIHYSISGNNPATPNDILRRPCPLY